MPFAGELTLDEEGKPLRAEIDFTNTDLVVSTKAGPVGQWPLDKCRIEPDNGRFRLSIEGERAWFLPDDAPAFTRQVLSRWGATTLASAVNAVRAAAAPASQKADSDSTFASEPDDEHQEETSARFGPARLAQLGMGLIVIAVVTFALLLRGGPGRRSEATIDTLPPSTTTTIVPVVFTSGLDQVTLLWNDASQRLGVELFVTEVATGHRMQVLLRDNLILYGTEQPDTRLVRTLMVAAGLSQGNYGQMVLAWGVLISVANPELDPSERRDLLVRLGVDVDQPLTIGLNTETIQGGARYWLISGVLGDRVLLGVHLEPPSES